MKVMIGIWSHNKLNKMEATNSFIKNKSILEEDYRVEDLLDFSYICSDFRKTLEKIESNSVIGLIGKFGSGKSTMLYQLYKQNKNDSDERWLTFDTWKYPERKDLWEGFVLEISKQLDLKLFNNAREKIDGTKNNGTQNLIKVFFTATNLFMPGTDIGKNFANLFRTSPARRVFEFQEILSEIIKKTNKNIYIIIEDIDRSGDKGIFFLETIRNFIKENKFNKNIFIIVPIGNDYYEGSDRQSYIKTLDYKINFNPSRIVFKEFIENVFIEDLSKDKDNFREQMNYLLQLFIKQKSLTIREIKHILRLANLHFEKLTTEEQSQIDIRILIMFQAVDYIGEKHITSLVNDTRRIESGFWGKYFLLMIATNTSDVKGIGQKGFETNVPIFIGGDNFNIPKFSADVWRENLRGYYMGNKYFEIFELL